MAVVWMFPGPFGFFSHDLCFYIVLKSWKQFSDQQRAYPHKKRSIAKIFHFKAYSKLF
jgi:hypothetical protein